MIAEWVLKVMDPQQPMSVADIQRQIFALNDRLRPQSSEVAKIVHQLVNLEYLWSNDEARREHLRRSGNQGPYLVSLPSPDMIDTIRDIHQLRKLVVSAINEVPYAEHRAANR